MRRLGVALVLAVFCGLLLAKVWGPEPVESRLVGLQLEAVMPQQAEALRGESLELQSALLDFAVQDEALAVQAWLAMQRYPEMSRVVLLEYADDPAFRDILGEYGVQVVPPIHHFMHNASWTLALRKHAMDAAASLRKRLSGDEAVPETELDATERGRYAIRFSAAEGHDFLGQFVVDRDGNVERVQTERITESFVALFTSGIRNVETRLRLGEDVRMSDAAWAVVDVAIGVSALKLLRMGRGTATAGRAARAEPAAASLGSTLLRGSRVGAQVARVGGPVALAYIVVRHPSLLNSAFGRLAEVIGAPVWLVQSLGWGLVLLPLFLLLQWALRPLVFLLTGCAAALRWCDTCLRTAPASAADRVEPVISAGALPAEALQVRSEGYIR